MDKNMKNIVIHNGSDKNIVDYRIEEAQIDPNTSDIIFDDTTQTYKKTGRTLEWSIKAGETVEFPKYVADYLRKIYDFLDVRNPKKVRLSDLADPDPKEIDRDNVVKDEDGEDSPKQ